MAVGGGATGAFRCQVQDRQLLATQTTTLRELCTPVAQAVDRLSRGEVVTVKATDITELRDALRKHDVHG